MGHAGLLAIKRQRLAVLLKLAARGFKVSERGLRFYEMKLRQGAGCVVNIDQQRAGQSTLPRHSLGKHPHLPS